MAGLHVCQRFAAASRTTAHDSGPSWIATPSMSGVLIPFLLPVYPGAPHVPCRSRRPGSRRLHAGHRLANKRAPARLIPESLSLSGFDVIQCFDASTAVRSRSPSRSPPDASKCAFSSSLTTTVTNQRSMRRFDASPHRGAKGSNLYCITSQTNRVGRSISSHPTGPLNATRETQRRAQVSIRSIWSDLAPTGTRLVSCTESSSRSSSSQLLRHQPVAAIQTAGGSGRTTS